MAEFGSPFEDAPPVKQRPIGVIAAVVTFLLLTFFAVWITRDKKNDQARQAVLASLDKELTEKNEAMKTQREKLVLLSQQVDTTRAAIQSGQVKSTKASIAEFNKLAAEQRAERELYAKMAEEYNAKVAEYRKLEQ